MRWTGQGGRWQGQLAAVLRAGQAECRGADGANRKQAGFQIRASYHCWQGGAEAGDGAPVTQQHPTAAPPTHCRLGAAASLQVRLDQCTHGFHIPRCIKALQHLHHKRHLCGVTCCKDALVKEGLQRRGEETKGASASEGCQSIKASGR